MANFLESLGMGGGIDVHISISPACGIEMTTLDAHGNVKSYAQMPLDYNEAQREVSNYDDLRTSIETFKRVSDRFNRVSWLFENYRQDFTGGLSKENRQYSSFSVT